jgi:hypothetical protein
VCRAYSLLLNKGLFRIFIPVPSQTLDPTPHPTEFTVTVANDPPGCNTDPAYNKAPASSNCRCIAGRASQRA